MADIFFDTEFIEDGKTIELISIGLVSTDGRTYYAEFAECDHSRASEWVKQNVLPHLTGPVLPRRQIAQDIIDFVGEHPRFHAYYGAYDWVALCQLYGTMMDLPPTWPMFCIDIKQTAHELGDPPLPEQLQGEHNALADAEWTLEVSRHLEFCAAVNRDDD